LFFISILAILNLMFTSSIRITAVISPEYPLVILVISIGGMLLMSSSDIISMFLSLLLQSYVLYIIASPAGAGLVPAPRGARPPEGGTSPRQAGTCHRLVRGQG